MSAGLSMKTFIAECRRRRVFRLAGLYVVGCWGVLQVVDLALENWGVAEHAIRFVWIAAIIGFPVALLFGWRFDIVGGRIQRTADGVTSADPSIHTIDYLVLIALGAIVIAVSYGIGTEVFVVAETEQELTLAKRADPMSIAVLPFSIDDQESGDSEFLASGIQDELLTRLSLIQTLKVTSRTSVERYRETTTSIPMIGKELGVAKILEGRIQRVGDQIRVNIQLIDAEKDEHLWADTFDKRFTASNVFDIQTEIVEAIAQQLEVKITPAETQQLASMPTDNLSAYSEYLKGKHLAQSESVESMTEATTHFKKAIEFDPALALPTRT